MFILTMFCAPDMLLAHVFSLLNYKTAGFHNNLYTSLNTVNCTKAFKLI